MKAIKIYILNGFLGSGKTTLLRKMLQCFHDKKVAVLMNEFGKHDVDGLLLDNESIELKTIHNGSIFCSCKSDKFVEAMLILIDQMPDIIIIESSGLANPVTMPKILDTIKELAQHELSIQGSIGIFDATNIFKLVHTAVIIKQQIATSSLILLNKEDLATEEQITESIKIIRVYNEHVPILTSSFCNISFDILNQYLCESDGLRNTLPTNQHMVGIHNLLIQLPDFIEKVKLTKWIESFKGSIYRLKGFYRDDHNNVNYIEVMNDSIRIRKFPIATRSFLVVFAPANEDVRSLIQRKAKEILETEIKII